MLMSVQTQSCANLLRTVRRSTCMNLMGRIGMSTSFEAVVPVDWAIIGLGFCTAVGTIYGMVPAIMASRLNPIDALRYE